MLHRLFYEGIYRILLTVSVGKSLKLILLY